VRPVILWDELHDSSLPGYWHLFVTERQAHYAANPDGQSSFEGHLVMVNALETLLAQL
jgi:hypothetical protein